MSIHEDSTPCLTEVYLNGVFIFWLLWLLLPWTLMPKLCLSTCTYVFISLECTTKSGTSRARGKPVQKSEDWLDCFPQDDTSGTPSAVVRIPICPVFPNTCSSSSWLWYHSECKVLTVVQICILLWLVMFSIFVCLLDIFTSSLDKFC